MGKHHIETRMAKDHMPHMDKPIQGMSTIRIRMTIRDRHPRITALIMFVKVTMEWSTKKEAEMEGNRKFWSEAEYKDLITQGEN